MGNERQTLTQWMKEKDACTWWNKERWRERWWERWWERERNRRRISEV